MNKQFLQRTLLLATTGIVLGLAGCSKDPAPSTPDQVKAFEGDPALKAKAGAAYREKAMAAAAAGQAAAQSRSVPTAPKK